MVLRVALALAVMVSPTLGQTIEPQSRPGEAITQAESKPVPWLVTVLYELSVKDLIADLQAQGLAVSTVEGIPESQLITNIVSGLVISPSGRIVSRLANFRVKPKPENLTVITSDGRQLKPQSVEYDPASGYTVLEVANLAIQPPPFASPFALPPQGQGLRLLYQVPDWVHEGLAAIPSRFGQQPSVKRGMKSEASTLQPMEKVGSPTMSIRVMEDTVSLAPKVKELHLADHLDKAPLEIKEVDAPDGSVVLNRQGEVVGLMEFLGPAQGIVKSIEDLRNLADRLVMRDQPRRGWMGVRLAQLSDEEIERRFGAQAGDHAHVVVREVFPNSPAAQGDLKPEDCIRRINGQEINNLRELSQVIAGTPVGSEIPIEIVRGGEIKHLKVRIEPRPRLIAGVPRRSPEARSEFQRAYPLSGNDETKALPSRAADRLARLGIKVESLTQPMREFFGIDGPGGVLVTEVNTTGLAGQAGLRAGDAIIAVNGKRVGSPRHLETLLSRASRTGKTRLSVSRQREEVKITLDLSKPF